MAEIHPLPNIKDVERQASEWIARLNADDVSAEDRMRFEAWRQAHPWHARTFEELSTTWRQLVNTGRLVGAVALGNALGESSKEAIRQAAPESGIDHAAGGPSAKGGTSVKRLALFAAAATLTAVALGSWWWTQTLTPPSLFQTAVGQHANIELPDGSVLQLNSNSLARVDYETHMRLIRLERGEAFFKVQHDPGRPFWVVAGNSWVRAVGTAFNIYVRPSSVRVTVSEGTVKVLAAAESDRSTPSDNQPLAGAVSVLTGGQQVDVNKRTIDLRSLQPVELERSLAWRSGMVYFENEPLGEVVDELERYTTLQMVITDDALRDLPVGGTFQSDAQGADALLTMLHDGFGLQIRRDGHTAYIDRALDSP